MKKDILDNTTLLDLISKERKIKTKKEHKTTIVYQGGFFEMVFF